MNLEEAILGLIKGKDGESELNKKASSTPNALIVEELDKLASLEDMPEDISEVLKIARDTINSQGLELEYTKLAYEMASNGVITYEDIPAKVEELKRGNADPRLIKEAMKISVASSGTFGEAAEPSDNTPATGMYSVLTN